VYEFLSYRVLDVMTSPAVTIGPDTTLAEAEKLLDEHDWNGLPVVGDDGELRGFVTKLDILGSFELDADHVFPPYEEIMARPVSRVMSRDVQRVRPRTPLTRVLTLLVDSGHKSVPVVDDGRVVGVVAREDVLCGLRRAVAGEKPDSPI
jgi:CBS domain-containing protein